MYVISTWYVQEIDSNINSQDCDQASHATHVDCINFIHERRDLQFIHRLYTKYLRNLSWQFYLASEEFSEGKNLKLSCRKKFLFSYFVLIEKDFVSQTLV